MKKTLCNILLTILVIFSLQSTSKAQGVEFSTYLGFGWGIANSSSPVELGLGLRFPVADGLSAGFQFGLLSISPFSGGLNLNIHAAFAWEGFRLYAGPEVLFGSNFGFGAVAGIDFFYY